MTIPQSGGYSSDTYRGGYDTSVKRAVSTSASSTSLPAAQAVRGPQGVPGVMGPQGVGAQLPEIGAPLTAATAASSLVGYTTRFATTSGSITQPLPAATAGGTGFRIGWSAASDVSVTLKLTANGSDTIGASGSTFLFVQVGQVIEFQPMAGAWLPVSSYAPLAGVAVTAYTTALRPAANTVVMGTPIFDSTLKKPLWSTGTAWVDATGANA